MRWLVAGERVAPGAGGRARPAAAPARARARLLPPPVRLAACCAVALAARAQPSSALVTTPVGGSPGSVDANVGVTLERGKIEPNEDERSWQSAAWELYTVGVGYTFGQVASLKDLFVRLEYSYYTSPAEIVESPLAPGAVCPRTLESGCEIHPADEGHLITPQLGFNLIHEPDHSLGVFVKATIPVGVRQEKFVLPRLDLIGGGLLWGNRFAPWFFVQSGFFVGSGPASGSQNATIAVFNALGFEGKRWLPTGDVGLRIGPYFDGDLSERFDARYDGAFYAGVPTQAGQAPTTPAGTADRVRMMRFGVSLSGYVQLSRSLVLEAGYTQKIFGYDTPATQFFTLGARAAF